MSKEKKLRQKLTIMLIFILVAGLLNAKVDSNAGEYGFQFLKIPVSPELAGMGNAGDMLNNSPLAIFHSPVAFNWQRGAFVAASQTNWFVGTNMYNLAYRNVGLTRSFGFGVVYMDHGTFDRREENGTLIGNYYPMDMRVTGNYAFRLTPNINIGANANILYEKIDTSSSLAFTADLGYVFYTPIANTTFDFSVKNIGGSTKMDEENIDIPIIVDGGISTGFIPNEIVGFYPSLKVSYMRDHDNLLPALGLQMKLYDMLFIRAGYKFNYNEENLSAGFGLHYRNVKFDYSFMNNEIEGLHLFGLGWEF
ncbi:MAG: PorV/PorQ family protein [Candidatus Cloacimonetes bacterium]|nr:PorV/PorQ family protein [Candidatus Cloacimonadota bacterium]